MTFGSWLQHPTRHRIMSSHRHDSSSSPSSDLDLSFHGHKETEANINIKQQHVQQQGSLKELLTAIRRNAITELRLGWTETDCLFGAASYSIRATAKSLARALQQNTSITRVSLGHRCLTTAIGYVNHTQSSSMGQTTMNYKRRKQALMMILQALATPRLSQQITHLQIVLSDSLPASVLMQVLGSLSRLVALQLHAVRVDTAASRPSRVGSTTATSTKSDDRNDIVSRVLVHCKLDHLQSLALIDCGLTDETAIMLADHLHIRGGGSLARLSVRNNRRIGARGWNILAQAPVTDRLDASLCDMSCLEIQAIAKGIVKRPWPLKALWLNGNYRIDVPGLLAITSPVCCEKLVALDLSYCDIGDYKTLKTIINLHRLTPNARLQQLTMHGSYVSGPEVSNQLNSLLKSNSSLRVVRLNDPSKPKLFGVSQLKGLLTSLRDNYNVEELWVDSYRTPDEEHILQEMDFFMRLNRAGRRIFRLPSHHEQEQPQQMTHLPTLSSASHPQQRMQLPRRPDHDEWLKTLERAGDDLDVLFWLIKQSAERFATQQPMDDDTRQRRPRKRSTSSLMLFIRGRSDRTVVS